MSANIKHQAESGNKLLRRKYEYISANRVVYHRNIGTRYKRSEKRAYKRSHNRKDHNDKKRKKYQ